MNKLLECLCVCLEIIFIIMIEVPMVLAEESKHFVANLRRPTFKITDQLA